MRERAWLIPLFAHSFLVQAVTFVLRPAATYQALQLDVAAHWLGALAASFAVVPLVLAVPTGHAVDRFGERRAMLVGSVLTLLSALAFVTIGRSVWGLLGATMVLGTGHLLAVVGQQAMVANRAESHRYDTAFGHYTFVASAGQALGPALIVLFGGSAPIPDTGRIFVWAVGLTALLVVISATVREPAAQPHRRRVDYGTFRDLLRQRGLVRALTTSCVVLAAVDISLVYLPALGAERDIASGTIGALLGARAVASMTSRLFLGRLVDWLGRPRALTWSVALSAVTMALLPLPVPLWLLVCFVVAMGLGLGVGQPVTMSWLAEASPPGMRGRAMSLRLTGNRLGQVLVPSLSGLFAVGAGAAGVLWLTAGALATVGVLSRGLAPPSPGGSA